MTVHDLVHEMTKQPVTTQSHRDLSDMMLQIMQFDIENGLLALTELLAHTRSTLQSMTQLSCHIPKNDINTIRCVYPYRFVSHELLHEFICLDFL